MAAKISTDARFVISLMLDLVFPGAWHLYPWSHLESFGIWSHHFPFFSTDDLPSLWHPWLMTGVVLSRSWLMSGDLHFRAKEVSLGCAMVYAAMAIHGLSPPMIALTHWKAHKTWARWFYLLFNQLEISDISVSLELSWDVGLVGPSDHLILWIVAKSCARWQPLGNYETWWNIVNFTGFFEGDKPYTAYTNWCISQQNPRFWDGSTASDQGYQTDYNASGYPEKFSESCVAQAAALAASHCGGRNL